MKILKRIFLIAVFLLLTGANTVTFGMVKINVNIVDENNKPIGDTTLSVRFSGGKMPIIKQTDSSGYCSMTSNSDDGVVVGTAIKDGYYDTTFHHDFYVKSFGMWQPWGKDFVVLLRPILNPEPMYVRNTYFRFPSLGKEIGFDLMKADWVIPYGQGTHADFIFKVERHYDNVDNFDATMTLTFSNPNDGIQVVKDDGGGDFNVGSWFRLPRLAPDSGYQPKLQKRLSRGSYGRYSDFSGDNNYIFRVRSEVDENGKLKRAMYGKIRGELKFSVAISPIAGEEGLGSVGMHYYLNPDYTPNLEFDPKRNLFLNLPRSENVTQP